MIPIKIAGITYNVLGFWKHPKTNWNLKDAFLAHPYLRVERWIQEENKYDLPEILDLLGRNNIYVWSLNQYVEYNGLIFNIRIIRELEMLADALEAAFAIEAL